MNYRIGVTDDAVNADGSSVHGDLRLGELVEAGIEWSLIDAHAHGGKDLEGLDAVYALGHRPFNAAVLADAPRLRHIARFGAGYDTIDLDACTAAGVVVTTTPGAVRRPVALAALTLVLAVTHNLVQKHELTVTSRWHARARWRGEHTDGATVAIVGFGSVGAELAGMLVGLGFTVLGVNRRGSHPEAEALGVQMVALQTALLADVVVLTAALTEETRGMIGARELASMRADAALVNVGRGGLVDQRALTAALIDGTIRAAALDVFDQEPPAADDPLLTLPNVTLAPHSLAWTASFTDAVVASANAAMLDVAAGRHPATARNPAAFDHERWNQRRKRSA